MIKKKIGVVQSFQTISIDTARLIEKIKNRSWLSPYYLVGGTALALHLGHRTSIDLDFFTEANMEEMRKMNLCQG